MGNRTVELKEQEFEFDFFEDFAEGVIKFADPEITLNIFTNAGILAALDFTEFKAADKIGGSLELSGSIMEDPFIIRALVMKIPIRSLRPLFKSIVIIRT